MAYIAPTTRTTGDLVTAAIWNADIVANEIAINAGAVAIASQAIGDLIVATSASQLGRLADVATGSVLVSGGVATAPAYSATGTGILTFLGTPSSANLAAAVTDETGSGVLVFATSPTINNQTVTNYVESVVAIGVVATTSTLSLTSGTCQTATLTASTACVFTMPTATAGKSFVLLLKQAAVTGSGTATFTSVKWGSSGAPTITATAARMDILTFIADGTNWYGSISQGFTP